MQGQKRLNYTLFADLSTSRIIGSELFELLKTKWGLQDPDEPVSTAVIQYELASGQISASRWVVSGTMEPDLPLHNSGSCYRNRNIFFDIPVPVNPEPEFQILNPVPELEIGFHRISARIYRNYFS